MKRVCWLLLFTHLGAMETTVDIQPPDLIQDAILQRAISNYFNTHDHDLTAHITEPLKKKLEESSGESSGAIAHVRTSVDMEIFTQGLITELLKEALQAKLLSDSPPQEVEKKNAAKYMLYTAAAGLITTITGILTTYFLVNSN